MFVLLVGSRTSSGAVISIVLFLLLLLLLLLQFCFVFVLLIYASNPTQSIASINSFTLAVPFIMAFEFLNDAFADTTPGTFDNAFSTVVPHDF